MYLYNHYSVVINIQDYNVARSCLHWIPVQIQPILKVVNRSSSNSYICIIISIEERNSLQSTVKKQCTVPMVT